MPVGEGGRRPWVLLSCVPSRQRAPVVKPPLAFGLPSSRVAQVCRAPSPDTPAGWAQPPSIPGHPQARRGTRRLPPRLHAHHARPGGAAPPFPRRGAARTAREPSAKRSVRTSGGLCAEPGRPPCAPLRCLLPPFCWGDPHPLPPDGEGDRLPLDRWLPVFRPSSRCLGLSLGEEGRRGSRRGTPPLQVEPLPLHVGQPLTCSLPCI